MSTVETAPVDPDTYRRAMRHHAGGVVVITVQPTGRSPVGCTVTSFTAASLDPPLVSFYLGGYSRSLQAIRLAGAFAVNVLGAAQHRLAATFARAGADRFGPPTRWWTGPLGVPMLDGASARLVCTCHTTQPIGDHVLVVGTVHDAELAEPGDPLLYAHGRFGGWLPVPGPAPVPDRPELDGEG